jgi:hypothetical protein
MSKKKTNKVLIEDCHTQVFELSPGYLGYDAKLVFTNGQCHALAIALSEKLSLPIKLVFNRKDVEHYLTSTDKLRSPYTELPDEVVSGGYDHALVSLGRGRYLDVEGVHSKKDVEEKWGRVWRRRKLNPVALVTSSADQLLRLGGQDAVPVPNVAVAKKFTAVVLRTYLG